MFCDAEHLGNKCRFTPKKTVKNAAELEYVLDDMSACSDPMDARACSPKILRRGIGVGVKGVTGSDAIVAQ